VTSGLLSALSSPRKASINNNALLGLSNNSSSFPSKTITNDFNTLPGLNPSSSLGKFPGKASHYSEKQSEKSQNRASLTKTPNQPFSNSKSLQSLDPYSLPSPIMSPSVASTIEGKVPSDMPKIDFIAQYTTNQTSPARSQNSSKSIRSIRPFRKQATPNDQGHTTPIRAVTPRRLMKEKFDDSTPLRPVNRSFRESPLLSGAKGESPLSRDSVTIFSTPPRHSSLRDSGTPGCRNAEYSSTKHPEPVSNTTLPHYHQHISVASYAPMEVPLSLRCVVDEDYTIVKPSPHFKKSRLSAPARLICESPMPISSPAPMVEVNFQPHTRPVAPVHVLEVDSTQKVVELEFPQSTMKFPTPAQMPEMSEINFSQPAPQYLPQASISNMIHSSVADKTLTRSNSVLHARIQALQRRLETKSEEIKQLKQQLDASGGSLGVASLSEQLRVSKKEAEEWKSRAEVAEKQIDVLTQFNFDRGSSANKTSRPGLMDETLIQVPPVFQSNKRKTKYSVDEFVVQERIRKALHGLDVPLGMDGASSGSQRCSSEDSTDTVIRSLLVSGREYATWAERVVEVEPVDFID